MKSNSVRSRRRIDPSDLFWLAYLVFFFIEPLVRRSVAYWLLCLGIAAVFVCVYLAFFWVRGVKARLVCIAGMFILGALTYPINGGATTFFIYAGAVLPFVVESVTIVVACLIFQSLFLLAQGWLLHLNIYNTLIGIFLIMIVGGSNIFFAQKRRAECKLQMAREEIEALAAVAERERIARDLHDVLGHTLSVIVLKAELAGRLLARGEDVARATEEIGDVERTARSALAEVRETIGGYRTRGLAAEMDAARSVLSAAGVHFEVEGAPVARNLRPAEETVLALALREAVTNVVRHAQARTCKLRFAMQNGRYALVIEDDGQNTAIREGNGLRGMRERVESMGGTLHLERERGTRLLIELPVAVGGAS